MVLKRIEELRNQNLLDAILVSDGFNIRYISGFSGETGYLYISNERHVLLTDTRYTIQAKMEAKEFEVIEVSIEKNYGMWIGEFILEDNVKRLGFEDLHMKYFEYFKFNQMWKLKEWVALENSLNSFRMVKTEEEIKKLAQAEAIGDKAFQEILNILKPGMTELEVAAELEYHMKRNGASGLSFDTIAASGINSSMPHATPTNRKLETGDFLTMDYGCVFEGYCSDMTRTVVIGKASQKQKEIYQIVLKAQLAALDAICAGKTGSEIDKVARDIIEKEGYGEYFGHGLGHSVGLFIHEEPRLSPVGNIILEENVIETVEPGIYLPGFGGVRIEDMVVVKKDGCINLTHSTKELIEI
ncbi:aminopeptidase P family protein [Anaerosacchariphilus polymeriproducens]|uniref:Aminopeptidase P family protein n=1 Tax=Anaerosacchariphilus polymeriproducens TaxID=1812858 RepID=A0A371AXM1_9FIRM|nr:aminopeptidase P family protein [Anaerosacchariphilus polymeriproducens]RDU24304.1 aminopeptidase P family protein [Anaerosacchariphilus polymeriproducens]